MSKIFNHIFVPYDGSNYSKHAFQTALEIAIKFGARITVITCLFQSPDEEPFYITEHAKMMDHLKNNIVDEIMSLQKIATTSKIRVDAHVMTCNSVIETLTTFCQFQ